VRSGLFDAPKRRELAATAGRTSATQYAHTNLPEDEINPDGQWFR
jgi:hypothetical protein